MAALLHYSSSAPWPLRLSSYGYRGRDCRCNLYLLPTGETVYFIASVVVLFNVDEQLQRHYTGHTDDIKWWAGTSGDYKTQSGTSGSASTRSDHWDLPTIFYLLPLMLLHWARIRLNCSTFKAFLSSWHPVKCTSTKQVVELSVWVFVPCRPNIL